jgi:exosome complex component RRP43
MTEHTDSNSAEQETLKALTFQRLHPKTYLQRFLAEDGLRPDGRTTEDWRSVSVNVGW